MAPLQCYSGNVVQRIDQAPALRWLQPGHARPQGPRPGKLRAIRSVSWYSLLFQGGPRYGILVPVARVYSLLNQRPVPGLDNLRRRPQHIYFVTVVWQLTHNQPCAVRLTSCLLPQCEHRPMSDPGTTYRGFRTRTNTI